MNTPVSFELAKLLKEKGFDEPTKRHYTLALTSQKDNETGDYTGSFGWKEGELSLCGDYFINNHPQIDISSKNWYLCSAPTIAEVVMWLYDKHDVWIEVRLLKNFGVFYYEIPNKESRGGFKSPTEAYEAALNAMIKYLEEAI